MPCSNMTRTMVMSTNARGRSTTTIDSRPSLVQLTTGPTETTSNGRVLDLCGTWVTKFPQRAVQGIVGYEDFPRPREDAKLWEVGVEDRFIRQSAQSETRT